MEQDVFISYSSKDKTVADAVCAVLEQNNIRCFYAPRDIPSGSTWDALIPEAIRNCKIMIIIFSESANASKQIDNEIRIAFKTEKWIIPLRINNIEPTGSKEYYLQGKHWLDAMTPPLEAHIATLLNTIRRLLNRQKDEPQPPPLPGPPGPRVPIVGAMITDSTGTKTKLPEYGVVYNSYAEKILGTAVRDYLIIEQGSAIQKIPWNLIERVDVRNQDAAKITLRDGKSLDPVKLRSGCFVGTDELGFAFILDLTNLRSINLLRDKTIPEREALMREIPILAERTPPNASYACTFETRARPRRHPRHVECIFSKQASGHSDIPNAGSSQILGRARNCRCQGKGAFQSGSL